MHMFKQKTGYNFVALQVFLLLALLAVLIINISIGYSWYSPRRILSVMTGRGSMEEVLVIFSFRLPRIVLSMLIGSALSVSGCILQGITRNPLADASLLGISSGGGLMLVLYTLFFGTSSFLSSFTVPFVSFVGAFMAAALVYGFSFRIHSGISPMRLILSGIGVQAGLSALMLVLVVLLDESQYEFAASWQAGTLSATDWKYVYALLPYLAICFPYAILKSRSLDVLALGTEMATSLGVRVEYERRLFLVVAVALAGSSVALGGNIGFVGLVVPHLSRFLVGSDHRKRLWTCMLLGSVLVSLSDGLGRVLLSPQGVPTGVITAILAAPYFIFLVIKQGRIV